MAEDFEARAATWDDDPARLARVRRVADVIRANVPLTGHPVTVELGAGTGMLSRCLAAELGPVTLLDASPAMIAVANRALETAGLGDWATAVTDLATDVPGGPYDLALAQMSLHHMDDVPALLARLHQVMVPGGMVAIADLDHDAVGGYHAKATDFHGYHGFRRDELRGWLEAAGYSGVVFHDAGVVGKEVDGERQDFPLFLALAQA
ncbi:MAG: class I SAM-dependent methyltransferase [Propionibacterium sp.]|nr:class I SAM-dependent methyltransferase [Propionibacterium sp.]